LLLNIFVKFLQKKKNINKKLVWIFDPSTRFIIDLLGKNWSIIYDCVDFWQATAKTRKDKNTIKKNEKRLTKESNLVTAISVFMKEHLEKYRKDIHLVPQGFRVKDFENKSNYKATKIKAKKPIIGFAGAVNDRLDYNLLLPLAKRNPNWSFVIWGPVLEEEKILEKVKLMKKELLSLPNVSTGFLKDRRKLPGDFKQFDISMIPYDVSQAFNKNCYPMKIFEFFYLGKPIVSTDIIELRRFTNLIRIGKNVREWEEIINDLLLKKWPINYKKEQKKLARENSWQNKIKTITRFLK
jgi:glycosyltransferase involved in cell wall biosynthesis